ncbi:uncharacterized protein LOC121791289 [Salvia splendens]|uniref:uncharacterized protein LOC121791289 n=1 Tax=Salvia splendens TaxID=180675 RepID=UPI001C27DF07|nr:uncharacterized protein LOC121791289 [Salvia splendens]
MPAAIRRHGSNPSRPQLRPHNLRSLPKAAPPPISQHHPLHRLHPPPQIAQFPLFAPQESRPPLLSSLLQRTRPLEEKTPIPPDFKGAESVYSPSVLKPWPYEFYCKWGRWILPKDCILIGGRPLDGKVLWCFESDRVVGCVFSENDHVGLIKVGIFMGGEDDSEIIKPSYESRILTFLWGMGEDGGINWGLFLKLVLERKDEEERLIADEIRFWGVVGVEICEILMRLHLEGLTVGYLSLNCLGFDDFGRVLLQLFVKAGFELDSRNVSKVGPVSDVWSLASLLVCVLVGSSFEEEMESFLHSVVNAVKDEKGCDYDGLYLAWMGKVSALLKSRLGSDFASLLDVLCRCLGLEPGHRPLATELWKCLRGLVVKPQCDIGFTLKNENKNQESGGYIVLGDVCCMVDGTGHGSKGEEEAERDDARLRVEGDVVDGITRGDFKCLEVKGTGLHGIYYRNVSHVK